MCVSSVDPLNSGLLTKFRSNQSGSVAIIFSLAIYPVFLAVGMAVDYGRIMNVKSRMQTILDSAALAGGRAAQFAEGDYDSVAHNAAKDYFNSMDLPHAATMDADGNRKAISLTSSNSTKTEFSWTATAWVETPILNAVSLVYSKPALSGAPQGYCQQSWWSCQPVSSTAAALLKSGGDGESDIEISLALDVTGSMCADGAGPCTTSPKLDALKTAAKDLVNIAVWSDQSKAKSRVALVPFSTRIRVEKDGQGGTLMKKLTDLDATWTGWYKACLQSTGSGSSEGSGNWQCLQYGGQYMTNWKVMPCITDRFKNTNWNYWTNAGTDDREWDLTDDKPGTDKWLNAHGGDRMVKGVDSRSLTPSSKRGLTSSDPAEHWNFNWNGSCADVHDNNVVVPLTSDKTALNNSIDGLRAYGATAGPQATQWAWYMLSPKWTGIWPSSSSDPASYSNLTVQSSNGEPKLKKVAIIMSDGVFNTYRGWKDQDKTRMANYAKKLCLAMKTAGIEVFTVGFALNELAATEQPIALNTLQQCGKTPSHFYQADTVNDLKMAFRDIAVKVASLRLSK